MPRDDQYSYLMDRFDNYFSKRYLQIDTLEELYKYRSASCFKIPDGAYVQYMLCGQMKDYDNVMYHLSECLKKDVSDLEYKQDIYKKDAEELENTKHYQTRRMIERWLLVDSKNVKQIEEEIALHKRLISSLEAGDPSEFNGMMQKNMEITSMTFRNMGLLA